MSTFPTTRNRPCSIEWLLSQPEPLRTRAVRSLSDEEAQALLWDWEVWARDEQLPPPGEWTTWLYLAGRGAGKTRTAGEWLRRRVTQGYRRIALVGKTPADVRDTMIEGESGLLAISPPGERPTYEPSKRRLTWPNGAFALAFSGAEPDQLRGPQFDTAWCDELFSFRYPRETWDNLQFGLRLGDAPRTIVSSTPRPVKLVRELMADPATATTRGSTYSNRVNLPRQFFRAIIARYEGTRTGQQEIHAQVLEEAEGALWTRALLEANRARQAPGLVRIVVAVDPSGGDAEWNDEVGIIGGGIAPDGHVYVLADESGRYTPNGWAERVVALYDRLGADRVVAEVNFGGAMVESTLRTARRSLSYAQLHASRSKMARAEPVAALYEQGLVHHVGAHDSLEDELCGWEPNRGMRSPNRLDALVWVVTELALGDGGDGVVLPEYLQQPATGVSSERF